MIIITNNNIENMVNLMNIQTIFRNKIIQDRIKENEKIMFLNKKRNPDYLFNQNQINFQKDESQINNNIYDFNKNEEKDFSKPILIEKESKIKGEDIRIVDDIYKLKDNFQLNKELKDANMINKFEPSLSLNNINKNDNNKNGNILNEYQSNYKNIENNFVKLKRANLENSTNIQNALNAIKTKNMFVVHKYDGNGIYSNIDNNNNEVKVFKNHKVVYVNASLLNSYHLSKNLKKVKKIAFIEISKRSSKYRGVSKNGNQWQVLIMYHKSKSYIGSFSSEEIAARVYDILAIKKRGFNARTNFVYSVSQMEIINEMNIDIKAKNINEIIENLFS